MPATQLNKRKFNRSLSQPRKMNNRKVLRSYRIIYDISRAAPKLTTPKLKLNDLILTYKIGIFGWKIIRNYFLPTL